LHQLGVDPLRAQAVTRVELASNATLRGA